MDDSEEMYDVAVLQFTASFDALRKTKTAYAARTPEIGRFDRQYILPDGTIAGTETPDAPRAIADWPDL
jgi:hypothetical protein